MRINLTECRLCRTPTNRAIWCSNICCRWNMVYNNQMLWQNRHPKRAAWDKFCELMYGETRPLPSWRLRAQERKTAAIYQEETDPKWIKKLTTV